MNLFNPNRPPQKVRGPLDLSGPVQRPPAVPGLPGAVAPRGPGMASFAPQAPAAAPQRPAEAQSLIPGVPGLPAAQKPPVRGVLGYPGQQPPAAAPAPAPAQKPAVRGPLGAPFQVPGVQPPAPSARQASPFQAPPVPGQAPQPEGKQVRGTFGMAPFAPQPPAGPTVSPNVAPKAQTAAEGAKQVQLAPSASKAPEAQVATAPAPDPWTNLQQAAQNAMNATEDPVSTREFNRAIVNMGLANEAERAMLQAQINSDPDLKGQPAGRAMMAMLSRSLGLREDDLRARLSVEAARAVREINQWGFEQYAKITESRERRKDAQRAELLAAGDFDGYARLFEEQTGVKVDVSALKALSPATQKTVDVLSKAMLEKVKAGDMDGARRLFEQIKALAPSIYGALNFEDVVTGKDAFILQNEANQAIGAAVRLAVAQGNTAEALKGIEQLTPQTERVTKGEQIINSKSLEEINKALQAAGMAPVTDKAELIGRADDVFKATELANMKTSAGKSVIDASMDYFTQELGKLGYNITDPDAMRALREYVFGLETGAGLKIGPDGKPDFDANSLIPPWKAESLTSHLYTDWPTMGPDGKPKGGYKAYSESNPRPLPDSELGKYYEELDTKWEQYGTANAKNPERLTRDQWFIATKGGTQEPDLTLVQNTKPQDPGDPVEFEKILQAVRGGQTLSKQQQDTLIKSGRLTDYSPKGLAGKKAQDLANENAGLVTIGGKLVQVLNETSSKGRLKFVTVLINGIKYKLESNGDFFAYDANFNDPNVGTVDPWKPAVVGGAVSGALAGAGG